MAFRTVVLSRASTITAVILGLRLVEASAAVAVGSPQPREAFSYVKTESPLTRNQPPALPLDRFRLNSAPSQFAILPALPKDYAALLESTGGKPKTRAMQIGVGRSFEQPVIVNAVHAARDRWTTLTNGWRIFSAYVSSSNALGMRLHFQDLLLPSGARIVIYDPLNTA